MKTEREANRLRKMALKLEDFLQEAGYKVEVSYHNDVERFAIQNLHTNETHEINVLASSVSACARDIFRQGVAILRELEGYI